MIRQTEGGVMREVHKIVASTALLLGLLLPCGVLAGSKLPQCPSNTKAFWKDCQGTFTYSDGSQYVGEFRENEPNGQGIKTLPNGDKYVGEFKQGTFNGRGTLTYGDGTKYVGGFYYGNRHYLGTYYASDGSVLLSGVWEQNKFVQYVAPSPQASASLMPKTGAAPPAPVEKQFGQTVQSASQAEPQQTTAPPAAAGYQSSIVEKRIALIIGNSRYQNIPKLSNPTNDARLIAETLSALGFTLVGGSAQLDLDKSSFDRTIRNFGSQLQGADVALFYYAGHGLQVRGANYLVPVNANPAREADVDFELEDVALVLRQMEGSGTRLNLVFLDACRNNPFGGRGLRSTDSGLAQMKAPEGTLISFATQPGNVALDGNTGNSPFTSALARTIRTPGLGVFDAINQVGLTVKRATGGAQQPWFSTSPIDGSFYFASAPTGPQAAPAAAVAPVAGPVPRVSIPPATAPPKVVVVPPKVQPPPVEATGAVLVLPETVSPKHSSEEPGQARMHTCLEQYVANKATNSNGGLKWVEQGGGYYTACNQRLKQ